jgi:hypothetical protein
MISIIPFAIAGGIIGLRHAKRKQAYARRAAQLWMEIHAIAVGPLSNALEHRRDWSSGLGAILDGHPLVLGIRKRHGWRANRRRGGRSISDYGRIVAISRDIGGRINVA